MFRADRSKDKNNSNSRNIKTDWLSFLSSSKKDSLLNSLSADNKFIQQDIKLRSMVIEALEKEFGKNIPQIKNYEFLVDSVVSRLKKNQLDSMEKDQN